jgi:hypothetical protein
VAAAGSHEVETPKPKHRACWVWAWPVWHLENKREWRYKVTQRCPYLARQLSVSRPGGPAPTSNDAT